MLTKREIENVKLRERIEKLRAALLKMDTLSNGDRSCGCHYGFKQHSVACAALKADDEAAK